MSRQARAPLVIMGMHRSGTTLITELLEGFGMFAGHSYGRNKEDIFFQRRNEWLLRRSGGGWDNPLPIYSLLQNESVSEQIVDLLRSDVEGYEFRRHRKVAEADEVWGWKDPRTIFTLPLWLRVFPNVRLLYIKRNGVDVAESLRRRATRADIQINAVSSLPLRIRLKNVTSRYESYIYESMRCCDLMDSFRLWEEYTMAAEQTYESFSGRKMNFKYEDFMSEPAKHLKLITDFAGLQDHGISENSVVHSIDAKRRFAFLSEPRLVSFYREIRNVDLMRLQGYGDIEGEL